ncbi:hypothetical protein ILYODFUR_025581 [Ilyodon furcidens]|uniref:Uncharacterized protein n=1 Tax=Ilyodon furcidens TaxID=33524 RepID=A0ABV0TLL5_9TELE
MECALPPAAAQPSTLPTTGSSTQPPPHSHPLPSPKKMSLSLTTDIQQEGESGQQIEPCSRGKTSPQPQGTKDGTGEGPEPDDNYPQDAQQRRATNHSHGRKRAKVS